MSKLISVYGGYGFVLGEFCKQFPDEVIIIPKRELVPQSKVILYGISTTDNYNVFDTPALDIETNLLYFMDVLDTCKKTYDNQFEFHLVSTWFVYNAPSSEEFPIDEDEYCTPTGFYSISARCREQLLISYCETFGIKYKILRLANVLGANDKKVSKKKNALQYLIKKIVNNEDIELYDNGEFYRDYIDVRDCADAIKLSMNGKELIYNISNGVSYRFRDLIDYAIGYSDSKSNILDMEVPKFHTVVQSKDIFLSNERLKEAGYQPEYSIYQTLREIIDSYKENR